MTQQLVGALCFATAAALYFLRAAHKDKHRKSASYKKARLVGCVHQPPVNRGLMAAVALKLSASMDLASPANHAAACCLCLLTRITAAEAGRQQQGDQKQGSTSRPAARSNHCAGRAGLLRREQGRSAFPARLAVATKEGWEGEMLMRRAESVSHCGPSQRR